MTMRLTATLFTPIPGGIEVKTDSLKMWDTLDGLCTTNPEDCQNIYNETDSAGFTVNRKYRLTEKGLALFRQNHGMKYFATDAGRMRNYERCN